MSSSFSILAEGLWRPGSLSATWTEPRRPQIDEVERAIDAAWEKARERLGAHLFDGKMCRLESFEASSQRLRLSLSPTSYKPFFGTNLSNAHFANKYGSAVLANPVGCSIALTTSDGWLLLGRRSDRVAYYPNRIHPFAGSLEPSDTADVFTVVYRELGEELSLRREDIVDVCCLGLISDMSIRQPELVFSTVTSLDRAAVEKQLDPAEHESVFAVKSDAGAIRPVIVNPLLTPVAAGTLTRMLSRRR